MSQSTKTRPSPLHCLRTETVGQGEQLGQHAGGVPDRLPRRLGERSARPHPVYIQECSFEVMATRQIEARRAHGRTDRSRCLVELRQHRDDGTAAVVVVFEVAELSCLAFDEREESDRVVRIEPAQRLPVACGERRDHEVQAGTPESDRGVEGALQTVERNVARIAEPRLLVEVVDGDETADAGLVRDLPVVAARAHRQVLGGVDVEVPAVAERIDDGAHFEAVRRRLHPTDSTAGALRIGVCRRSGPPLHR